MRANRTVSTDHKEWPLLARLFFTLLIASTALIVRAPAGAQTVDAQKFQAYIASPAYQGRVKEAIASISPEVFQKCPTLQSNGSQVTLLQSVKFGSNGTPTNGSWANRFPVSGCGNDTILNIFFTTSADGADVKYVVGLPGTTIGTLVLQKDAFVYASAAFAGHLRECKDAPVVKNTRFESFGRRDAPLPAPKNGQSVSGWWETWTMSGCKHVVDVPITFVTQAKGTQVIVSSKDLVDR